VLPDRSLLNIGRVRGGSDDGPEAFGVLSELGAAEENTPGVT